MKLSIAVGFLSAHKLPTVVSEGKLEISERRSMDTHRLWTSKGAPLSANGSRRSEASGPRVGSVLNVESGRSSSSRGSTMDTIIECDPDASFHADVGVLACGTGHMCVASAASRMGGFCTDTNRLIDRRLQTGLYIDICYETSQSDEATFFEGECDCSAFDMENKSGSILCIRETGCLGISYYGCYNTCVTTVIALSYVNGERSSRERCNELIANGDVLSATSLCTTFSADETCETKLDGQKCTSCSTDYPNPYTFDCSNVADGVMKVLDGRFERLAYLPIVQACYKPVVDGTFCDLCGHDFGMEYRKDTTTISLDGFGDNLTCSELVSANSIYLISSDKCAEASSLAKAECCGYKCDICPGNDLHLDHATAQDPVFVNGYRETTCYELFEMSLQNISIPTYLCASIRDICCTDQNVPSTAPVLQATTTATPTNSTSATSAPSSHAHITPRYSVLRADMMLMGAFFIIAWNW